MNKKEIERIIKKNKRAFEILEEYDKTHRLPFKKKRMNIILTNKAIDRLKEISAETCKPMSRIIEEKVMGG